MTRQPRHARGAFKNEQNKADEHEPLKATIHVSPRADSWQIQLDEQADTSKTQRPPSNQQPLRPASFPTHPCLIDCFPTSHFVIPDFPLAFFTYLPRLFGYLAICWRPNSSLTFLLRSACPFYFHALRSVAVAVRCVARRRTPNTSHRRHTAQPTDSSTLRNERKSRLCNRRRPKQ